MIAAAELQMKAKLAEARASFQHKGIKGGQVEAAFRTFLRKYLPMRLSIAQGEVVDKSGVRSGQTDVVIANEDHPFTFSADEPGLFFVEGVTAGGEVKSVLTSASLTEAIESSRRWKKLRIKPSADAMIRTNPADRDRFYSCPPYFLMAMESELSLEGAHARLAAEGSFGNAPHGNVLDAVFLLDRGWVIDFGDGNGAFRYRLPDGPALGGWQRLASTRVLFDCLAWLSGCMPKMVQWEPVLLSYMMPSEVAQKPG